MLNLQFLLNLAEIYSDTILKYTENLLGQKKEQKMGIKNLSKDVLIAKLPSNSPKIARELKAVNETIGKKGSRNVVIDFSEVEIINSSNISNLLILHNLLQNAGRRLILCNVATVTKCIFVVAGLNDVFEFVDDQSAALVAVQHVGLQVSSE